MRVSILASELLLSHHVRFVQSHQASELSGLQTILLPLGKLILAQLFKCAAESITITLASIEMRLALQMRLELQIIELIARALILTDDDFLFLSCIVPINVSMLKYIQGGLPLLRGKHDIISYPTLQRKI